jgi:hypothetical protein
MISTNYISIKSVLSDLISTIEERYWNETAMLEWATKALRKIKIFGKYVNKVALIEVCGHKGQLPSDFAYLTQVAWQTSNTTMTSDPVVTLPNEGLSTALFTTAPRIGWSPMRLTANPYFGSICLDDSIINCPTCYHEFSVDENLIITTTLLEGNIMVAYLGYPTNDEGDALMPDSEELKDAILHYVLYRYWMMKYQMKEEGADKRMEFHLTMWSTLSAKAAGSLNMPDLSTLENIKNFRNRLVPSENQYAGMFLNLTSAENVNF